MGLHARRDARLQPAGHNRPAPTMPSSRSLNGKFRAECLNANWFLSLDEARRKCEAWRRDYNEVRPHSAIGNKMPMELHPAPGNPGQPGAR